MENKREEGFLDRIDVFSIMNDICREWWVILLFALSVSLFTNVAAKKLYKPEYTVQSTFVVTTRGMNTNISQNLSTTQEIAKHFSEILKSNVLQSKVEEDLGMDEFTGTTAVAIQPQTNLMRLSVTADSALEAYQVMCSIMENYSSVSDYVLDNVVMDVIEEPIIPLEPSDPLPVKRLFVFSFLLGGMFFVLLFGVFSYLKDTVKNEKEVSEKVDAKLLGVVYHEKKNKMLKQTKKGKELSLLISNPLLSFRFVESNKLAASKIRSYMDKRGAKTVLITSVLENEGKSTVAANLALALSQENRRVLLMDCDFRKPAQYKIFETPEEEQVDLPRALKDPSEMGALIKRKKNSGLYTLFNNTATTSAEELLENGTMRKLLRYFKENLDYIIIDSSPMALVADTEELAQMTDTSILVIRQDVVLAKDINDAIDALNNTNGTVLGCIFNDAVSGLTGITDRHGYGGYYGRQS